MHLEEKVRLQRARYAEDIVGICDIYFMKLQWISIAVYPLFQSNELFRKLNKYKSCFFKKKIINM